MKKVLIVTGTGGSFDVVDLFEALKSRGVRCEECYWHEAGDLRDAYDLAVLFGLSDGKENRADLFASAVRNAVGPGTKLLIVSGWDRSVMAKLMKERYDAEYFSRGDSMLTLTRTVLQMLGEAKTAP